MSSEHAQEAEATPETLTTPQIADPNRVAPGLRGGPALLAYHRTGKRLTQRQGILAKCADCMGEYRDGRVDCGVKTCPLYPWMPYR